MGKSIKRFDIPEEIMVEILSKLPVKSLLRFKCVSKSWRSLISSKYFIKQHLKKSSTYDDNMADSTHQNKLMFSFSYHPTAIVGIASCSLLCNEPIIKPNIENHPTEICLSSFGIVGACNGLILINVNGCNKLLLWNPSTRQVYNKIPVSSSNKPRLISDLPGVLVWPSFLYGFGYDDSKDEYKVVCIKVLDRDKPYETKMYSSKTGSWKKIGNFDEGFPDDRHAKFVNGRFHWLAQDGCGYSATSNIVSLDLLQEKYESVPVPNYILNSNDFCTDLELEDLGGYLCLVGMITDPNVDVSVWAMMEYGKRESWTKIWTLSDSVVDPFNRIIGGGMPMPLCLRKNGDITVAFGSDIVVYNGKNVVHKSRVDMLDAKVECVVYGESLVSPMFGDRFDEQ